MKTITLIFLILILSHECQAQVGIKRHIADKGVPPIQNISVLDIPEINNNAAAIVVVKELRNGQYGSDAIAGVVNPISVGYNASLGGHFIKYDDPNITMASGTAFNVMYAPRDTPGSLNGNFTHKAITGSIFPAAPNATVIDNSLTNNDGSWNFITSKYIGDDEVFNDIPINLYYNFFGSGEWVIQCNPNFSIPVNAEYSLIGDTSSVFRYNHITSSGNIDKILMSSTDYAFFTILDDTFINNNPDAIVFVEPIIPTGSSFAEFFFEYSVYYNPTSGFWELHIDLDSFPGSDFNFPIGITFKIYASNETSLSTPETATIKSISAHPNPTHNIFNIKAKTPITEVILFNILGQKLETIQGNGTQKLELNVSDYFTGQYFVKVKIEDRIETLRLIKN